MDPKLKEKFDELGGLVAQFQKANDDALAKKADTGHVDSLLKAKVDEINLKITGVQEEIGKMQEVESRLSAAETLLARSSAPGGMGAPGAEAEMLAAAQFKAQIEGVRVEEVLLSGRHDVDEFKAYKRALGAYMRAGGSGLSTDISMALSVGSDPSGGYMVPPDTSGRLIDLIYQTSPMREVANIQTIGVDALEGPRDLDEADSGWVGEQDTRSETDTPTLGEYRIPVEEQYAMPKTTQKLLDDGQFDVEGWLVGKVSSKMSRVENTAFVSGNGVKKPRGFLTYPAGTPSASAFEVIQQVASGAAGDFAATNPGDPLIDMTYALKAPLRGGAIWAMNSLAEAEVRKLKDGDGNYLWQPNFGEHRGGLLLGYPVRNFEDMPDIAANSLSVAFGNFRAGYTIVDRIGFRILRDPLTQKGYVLFYVTKRTGGDVDNFEAIKIMKFAV